MNKEVILTGLRSNGELHLGNYLGAIKPMVELQRQLRGQYQLNMFVPDLHSFTTETDHDKLYNQTISNVTLYLAAGLDIDNSDTYLYRQSRIPAHSELTWILSCFIGFGELRRMTQFKDKSGVRDLKSRVKEIHELGGLLVRVPDELAPDWQEHEEMIMDLLERVENFSSVRASAGLFIYPVLMAADILLYGAKWIPVGEDQRQHLELTRDLAIRMNNKFGDLFSVPEPWDKQLEFSSQRSGSRIRSLRHPEKKMSKSVVDPAGTIMLTDDPQEAYKKVMSATTDSVTKVNYDWDKQPGISNLLQIYALLSNKSIDEAVAQWKGSTSYNDLKVAAAKEVSDFLGQFQGRLETIDQKRVIEKLESDEAVMTKVANEVLVNVHQAVGLSAS